MSDLDAALDRFQTGRRWRIYTFDSSKHASAEHMGEPTAWVVRIALGDGSPQVELVEPVSETAIHRDWLEQRGEGLHHVGIVVSSVPDALRDLGRPALLSGSGFGVDGTATYAYVDTAAELGYLIEFFEPPTSLGNPDAARGD